MSGPARTTVGKDVWMELKSHEKLKAYMTIQDLGVRQFANAIGLGSHTYLAKLASGKATTAKPETAVRICLALGVTIDDLWTPKSSREARQAVDQYATLKAANTIKTTKRSVAA